MLPKTPAVLPIPAGATVLEAGLSAVLQPTGGPIYASFVAQGGWEELWDGNLTFKCSSSAPFNLGIYGPNPTSIGPPFGRMRAPKVGQPDGTSNSCEGNFTSGTYYLVFRVGDNGAPTDPITIEITQEPWQVFG
jgi:hypothetical protein